MPDEVPETVKQPVAGDPEGSPSQPKNPDPQPGQPGEPEPEAEKPGVEEPKPDGEEVDDKGVPLKNRLAEKERLIEKLKREAEERKVAQPPFDPEKFLDNLSQKHGVDKEALKAWLPIFQEVATGMTTMMVDPLKKRLAKSDYELQKSELKRDPDYAGILADREIEKMIDEEAAKLPSADWSNPQALLSVTRYVLGDPKIIARLTKKAGATKQTNKTIDAPGALAGGSRPAPAKASPQLTAEEREIAAKMKMTEEEYAKYKEG